MRSFYTSVDVFRSANRAYLSNAGEFSERVFTVNVGVNTRAVGRTCSGHNINAERRRIFGGNLEKADIKIPI